MAHLLVTLAVDPRGILVTWLLDGVALTAGEPLGQLPLSIAGAPTIQLPDGAVAATDAQGPVPLVMRVAGNQEGDHLRSWNVQRATRGPIEVSYLAEPVVEEPLPATPPLDLRREGGGLSGALKCFLVLPPGPQDLTFEVRWDKPVGEDRLAHIAMPVTSLGEGDGHDGELAGTGLELLGDTYFMWGDLADRHHRDGQLSTWWLTPAGIDVEAFSARLAATYQIMSEAFDAPAHAYRVFLRTHPHRGANASAHPASFVMAVNPADPLDEGSLYETIAHELVHEWLHLDGPADEVTWFSEGAADYYSLVLPFRKGLLEEEAFVRAVNLEARECYANARRDLHLRQAQQVFFSDFLAHRLPYARGMFYLADLDARLRRTTSGRQSLEDVVRSVLRSRRAGERVGIEQWCARVEQVLRDAEMPVLDAMVFTGTGRPREDSFGPRFSRQTRQVPILDIGCDPSTFVTRRVSGLVAGGAADRAGLRDGEIIDLPRYPDMVRLDVGDLLHVGVTRDGETSRMTIPLTGETALVPQWQPVERRPELLSADEVLDIVDEHDRVVGTARRADAYARRLRHRCVFILIRDSDGRVFVHRRTDRKLVFPSMYDMFVGGVVAAGESYDQAALREAEEELGVTGLEPPTPLFKFLYATPEHTWWSFVYEARCDLPVNPQREEVAWYAFLGEDELRAKVAQWDFVPDGLAAYRRLLTWWDENRAR